MKRVVCIGTLADSALASAEFVELYNAARVFNHTQGLTGVVVIAATTLLQVVEGDAGAVTASLNRLHDDRRLRDVSILASVEIESPAFKGWTIRFFGEDGDRHKAFQNKLNGLLVTQCEAGSELDRERLSAFIGSGVVSPAARNTGSMAGKQEAETSHPDRRCKYSRQVVSLSRWPKPSQLTISHELIKLCSRLVGTPVPFERLESAKLCASKSRLVDNLRALEGIGILKFHDIPVLSDRVAANDNLRGASAVRGR